MENFKHAYFFRKEANLLRNYFIIFKVKTLIIALFKLNYIGSSLNHHAFRFAVNVNVLFKTSYL